MQRDGDFVAAPVEHALDRLWSDKLAECDEVPEASISDRCLAEPSEQAVLLRPMHEDRLAADTEPVPWAPQSQGRGDRVRVRAQNHDQLGGVKRCAIVGRRLSRREKARTPRTNLEARNKVEIGLR